MLFARGGAEFLCVFLLFGVIVGIASIANGLNGLAKGKIALTWWKEVTGDAAKTVSLIYIAGGITVFIGLVYVLALLPE
jgi:hypothetical protein